MSLPSATLCRRSVTTFGKICLHLYKYKDSRSFIAYTVNVYNSCRRTVLALGAVPAAMTLYFREKMPETPRYTLHKEGNAAQMIADMAAVTGDSAGPTVSSKNEESKSCYAPL